MKKKDIVIIVVLLAIAGIGFLCLGSNRAAGDIVQVVVDGKIKECYSLSQSGEYSIDTKYGKNIFVIENGKVYMKEASCPDKHCVKQGDINSQDDTIVCLPNKVVIKINKQSAETGIDAIAE